VTFMAAIISWSSWMRLWQWNCIEVSILRSEVN
jgi:hypothetical protein